MFNFFNKFKNHINNQKLFLKSIKANDITLEEDFAKQKKLIKESNRLKRVQELMDNPKFIKSITENCPNISKRRAAKNFVESMYKSGALDALYNHHDRSYHQ